MFEPTAFAKYSRNGEIRMTSKICSGAVPTRIAVGVQMKVNIAAFLLVSNPGHVTAKIPNLVQIASFAIIVSVVEFRNVHQSCPQSVQRSSESQERNSNWHHNHLLILHVKNLVVHCPSAEICNARDVRACLWGYAQDALCSFIRAPCALTNISSSLFV